MCLCNHIQYKHVVEKHMFSKLAMYCFTSESGVTWEFQGYYNSTNHTTVSRHWYDRDQFSTNSPFNSELTEY